MRLAHLQQDLSCVKRRVEEWGEGMINDLQLRITTLFSCADDTEHNCRPQLTLLAGKIVLTVFHNGVLER